MPLYSDYGMYYGGVPYSSIPPSTSYISASPYSPLSTYGSYSGRIMVPTANTYSSQYSFAPSRYTPLLSTITETPRAGRYSAISALTRINSPKLSLHSSPKYVAPRPIRVNTADIDVSSTRHKRTLPRITPTRVVADPSPTDIKPVEPTTPDACQEEKPNYMPRCDEHDGTPSNKNLIKRDRAIVRISTIRQKGPSTLALERGPPAAVPRDEKTPVIVLDLPNEVDQGAAAKRTWRDNFGEELVIKAREPVKKTPGELLLEKHLIKHDSTKSNDEDESCSDDAGDKTGNNCDTMLSMKKMRRPSFHDICQEISSDKKIESVDDLNAGELRRRVSLLPDVDSDDEDEDEESDDSEDEEEINQRENEIISSSHHSIAPALHRPVNKVTKSASGTLHCLLERRLYNSLASNESSSAAEFDGGPLVMGSRRKSVKRVHHKITAKVHIDEPTTPRGFAVTSSLPANQRSETTAKSPSDLNKQNLIGRQLNVTVEHVSEHHHVNHVVSLPNKKSSLNSTGSATVAIPKKITKPTVTKNDGEDDFWAALGGSRETVYINKRRQELLKSRLQTCTEVEENTSQRQFQESIPLELPQSTTMENIECPSLHQEAADVLCEVKEAQTRNARKMATTVDKVKVKTKTTNDEQSERRENKIDLKIASDTVKPTKRHLSSSASKPSAIRSDQDAKSPDAQRIDSHHEEEEEALARKDDNEDGGGDDERNKQTPASSIITFTTTIANKMDGSKILDNPETHITNKSVNATSATQPSSQSQSGALGKASKGEGVTDVISGGGVGDTTSAMKFSSTPIIPKQRGEVVEKKRKDPSGGNVAQISKMSTTKSTSKENDQHYEDDRHQSIHGGLSKFATIEDLNLLSVDIDQPSSVDEMAIEMAVSSRGRNTDPATTASLCSTAAVARTSEISGEKIGSDSTMMDKIDMTASSSAASSKSNSLSSQSLSPAPSTPKLGKALGGKGGNGNIVKKKRVVKKVHRKGPPVLPAEYSSSDVNIGNMSILRVKSVEDVKISVVDDGGGHKANENGEQQVEQAVTDENETTSDKGEHDAEPEEKKETIQELIRRVKGRDAKKPSSKFNPQRRMKFSPDGKTKLFTVDEKATKTLWATPRPLQKKKKSPVIYSSDEEEGDELEGEKSTSCSSNESYDLQDQTTPQQSEYLTLNLYGPKDKRVGSTCSNDSGFEGGTAPSSPRNMLGNHEPNRDSSSTPPSHNPAYKIDSNHSEKDHLDTSYTYAQFQRSGCITAPATSIPRFRKYTVEDFHFLAVLGKGSFGKVLLAELRNTTYYYAVKCLKKDVVLEDDDVECTLIERKVLALGTKQPYLCHLFCTFQTESHLFFVMEYLNGGDLMFHIQNSGRFPEARARFYAAEIISGLKFLHKKGIVYRDLKLDNVLLDSDGHVRIADFGMCKLQIYLDRTADSFCGTPDYMAPEIIKGQKYNQTVDWWSFGVLLYEMLIGQSPFSGCDEDELFWSICNEVPWIPAYLSKEAANIVKALLEKDASIRLGSVTCPLGDIADHRFFHFINWQKLERRELEPPFKPAVRHPLDTQYFDPTFTKERVRLTPIQKEILHSMDQDQFQGFSYTNPNATLT